MSEAALRFLAEARKEWRKNHPYGFVARPVKNPDGTTDLMTWQCSVPGKTSTPWEGGVYKFQLFFDNDYPNSIPKCQFQPPLFHPNVSVSGELCLTLIDQEKIWRPGTTVIKIVLGVYRLLYHPRLLSPAQMEAHIICCESAWEYDERVRIQAMASAVSAAEEIRNPSD
ncbi:hypothetical protein KR018_003033 [Drosophila ironensis]|nr:hypothetical protein KR018_003033 [Drosophila ironensis]